jgi:hypothetical protein
LREEKRVATYLPIKSIPRFSDIYIEIASAVSAIWFLLSSPHPTGAKF